MTDPLTALTLALEETEGEWRGCGSASWMAKVVWPVMEAHLAARAALAQPAPAIDVEALRVHGLTVRQLERVIALAMMYAPQQYAAIALAQPAPAPGIDVEALARAMSEEAASRDGTGLGWATLSGPVRDLWRASARRTAAAYAAIALAQPAPAPGIDVEALARALHRSHYDLPEPERLGGGRPTLGGPFCDCEHDTAVIAAAYAEEVKRG